MTIFDTYYILGAHRQHTDEDIKMLHKQLSHRWHPDKPEGNLEKFTEVQQAYTTLKGVARLRHIKEMELSGDMCPLCNGSGVKLQRRAFRIVSMKACHLCGGSGYVQRFG